MSSVCFYFQVHQPFRLKKLSYFDHLNRGEYFDDNLNDTVMKKVAAKCYLPTNRLLLKMIKKHAGAFRIAFSISGVAIEQMKLYSPETLKSFQDLAATGAVEFLGETYYHSLSALHPGTEFEEQVKLHSELMQETFGQTPTVFRNTELIYSDLIGQRVSKMGFQGMVAEGADDILAWRTPNFVYQAAFGTPLKLLLKNYRLSDDIAFRFSNRGWAEWPLTSEKFSSWVQRISGCGDTLNLFMDYETFGEHQWAEHGIFQFLEHLPDAIFRLRDWGFSTPSEVLNSYPVRSEISFPRTVSWADLERDITAWLGNEMQTKAWNQIYSLEHRVKEMNNPETIEIWRKLQTSDHFYYMCTKWFSDGDVHAYFSPYESPYEAFIFYENALRDYEGILGKSKKVHYHIPKRINLDRTDQPNL